MKKSIIFILLILLSLGVTAESSDINCSYIDENKVINEFKVLIDENNGKVTHTAVDGFSFSTKATFTENNINYQNVSTLGDGDALIKDIYEVNRADMSFTYSMIFEPLILKDVLETTTTVHQGNCK